MAAILELLFEDDPGAPIVVIVSSLFDHPNTHARRARLYPNENRLSKIERFIRR